jgi:hypothetical protein
MGDAPAAMLLVPVKPAFLTCVTHRLSHTALAAQVAADVRLKVLVGML